MATATRTVTYNDQETALTCFFAWDDAARHPLSGLLLVHGGAGLDDHAKGQARRYATHGYAVLACDMFGDGVAGNRERVMACLTGLRDDPPRLSRRMEAGLAALATSPEAEGRFAAVGFCFGGLAVLTLARSGADLMGVVSIHGSLATVRPAEPGAVKAKVLACHGALDPHVPSFCPPSRRAGQGPVANFGRVNEPIASRPYMPGYGTLPAGEGGGLLPWSWAEERLVRSHDFWLATVTPHGAPHLMPVWAVWHEGRLWFSSSNGSRKARNLGSEPRCTLSTDSPLEPVIVQGRAHRVTDPGALTAMLAAENAKYGTAYGQDMMDPASNSVFALLPEWVFALDSSNFTGSPTRFTFAPAPA